MSRIDTLHVCRENADGKRDTPRTLLRPKFWFDEGRQSQTIGWLADWRLLDGETHHEACAYRSAVKTVASRSMQSVLPHCGELLRNESLLITR